MSYILDALRKSHLARRDGTVSAPHGAVHNISLSLPDSGWWLTVGIILLMGISAAVLLFWRNATNQMPASPPKAVTSESVFQSSAVEVKKEVPPPQEVPAKSPSTVRDLAEEAKVPVPVMAKKENAKVIRPISKAEVNHPAETTSTFPIMPLVSEDTPLLQQMPLEFQQALPRMAVTIHVYSQQEAQRILFINNRNYHKGDQVEGGVRVEDIVPDGAILSYRGEHFKLGRPR